MYNGLQTNMIYKNKLQATNGFGHGLAQTVITCT